MTHTAAVASKDGNKKGAPQSRRNFWQAGAVYPGRLVEDMQDLEKLYKLRYQVYCEQKGFLNPGDYPDQCETDQFDEHSIHFGAFDDEGEALGTMRLVRNSGFGFPLFGHCEAYVPDEILEKSGEISRLAVSKLIRRRENDGDYGVAVEGGGIDDVALKPKLEHRQRRHRPDIVVGLYKALYQESKRRGITHWIAAMEPSLYKLLKRFYFNFEPIGPEVDYYGPVTPYIASLDRIEEQVYEASRPFYEAFVDGLEPDLIRFQV